MLCLSSVILTVKSQAHWFGIPIGKIIGAWSTPKTAMGYAPPEAIALHGENRRFVSSGAACG
jgi:hypothetical protein